MKNWFLGHYYLAGLFVTCALLRHPPVTSVAWDGVVENDAERTANVLKMRGATMTVSCACGRKQVDPYWRPWWRKSR